MSEELEIKVITRDGVTNTLRRGAGHETLMQLLYESDQGVEAACGGCASCATCHVYISEEWVDRIPPRDQVEDLLLTYSEHFDPARSRLSCQIQLSDVMGGLTLEIAPEE